MVRERLGTPVLYEFQQLFFPVNQLSRAIPYFYLQSLGSTMKSDRITKSETTLCKGLF